MAAKRNTKPRRATLPPRCEVQASALAPNGDGVAQLQDFELYVPDLLPGERAEVRVEHVSRQRPRAFGSVMRVIEPSAARREPPCVHRGCCTGCPLMIAAEPEQRRLKRQMLQQHFGIAVDRLEQAADRDLGYRWSSKRVVGGQVGAVRLGSYRRRTHVLADMDECLVDHPDIAACARELREAALATGVVPYDESERAGDLRYVWFKTNGRGEVLVCLVTAGRDSHAAAVLPARLPTAAGICRSVQPSTGNVLRGTDLEPLAGRPTLELHLERSRRTIEVGPLGFLQPNPPVASLAYRDLVADPQGRQLGGTLALDLYAGAGVTTTLLKERFQRVVPCESYPESAALLGVAPATTEEFLGSYTRPGTGERSAPQVDLTVANPPRAGLGPDVCARLNELASRRLHLMSCRPAALVRDLELLTGPSGAYRLLRARAYDTMPQTPHVELVVWLEAKTEPPDG